MFRSSKFLRILRFPKCQTRAVVALCLLFATACGERYLDAPVSDLGTENSDSTTPETSVVETTTTTILKTLAEAISEGKSCEQSWREVPPEGEYVEMNKPAQAAVRSTLFSCSSYQEWDRVKSEVRRELLGIWTRGLGLTGPLEDLCRDEPRANPAVCISRGEFWARFDTNPPVGTYGNPPSCEDFWRESIAYMARGTDNYSDMMLRGAAHICTLQEWNMWASSNGEDGQQLLETVCIFEPHSKLC
jgi:hypothetical protein